MKILNFPAIFLDQKSKIDLPKVIALKIKSFKHIRTSDLKKTISGTACLLGGPAVNSARNRKSPISGSGQSYQKSLSLCTFCAKKWRFLAFSRIFCQISTKTSGNAQRHTNVLSDYQSSHWCKLRNCCSRIWCRYLCIFKLYIGNSVIYNGIDSYLYACKHIDIFFEILKVVIGRCLI